MINEERDNDCYVALVTGASGRIGRQVCFKLAQEGYNIIAVDVSQDGPEKLADELKDNGFKADWLKFDVSIEESWQEITEWIKANYGKLDALVANAAITGPLKPLRRTSADSFDAVMSINVRGVYLGMRAMIPLMHSAPGPSIVVVSSIDGLRSRAGLAAYSASKYAVIGLTKTVAAEEAENGIRINAVAPGPVNTAMMNSIEHMEDAANPDLVHGRIASKPLLKRYAEPSEIAEIIRFLVLDKAGYVTGSVWTVDGGCTAH